MTEITSLTAALSAAKNAVDLLKFVQQSSSSLEKAEYQSKLAEILTAVIDLRGELVTVKEEVLARDVKIRELQDQLRLRGESVFEDFCYWLVYDGKKDGPYCQRCQDADGKFVRLQVVDDKGSWECMSCKNIFTSKAYRNRPRQSVVNSRGDW